MMGCEWRAAAAVPAMLLLLLLLCPRILPAEESPCAKGTFRAEPGPDGCAPCDVCDEGREYLQPCRPSANAVCRCPPGRECGGNTCVRCECPVGQQPTREGDAHLPACLSLQGCQSCPRGTFNNLTTGSCRPWTQCPGNRVLKPGTKESDVVCQPELKPSSQPSTTSPEVFPTKMTEAAGQLVPIAVAVAALILCLLVLLLFRSWAQEKLQEGPCGQPAQEVGECSYCYPEEEEGGRGSEPSGLKGEWLLEKIP